MLVVPHPHDDDNVVLNAQQSTPDALQQADRQDDWRTSLVGQRLLRRNPNATRADWEEHWRQSARDKRQREQLQREHMARLEARDAEERRDKLGILGTAPAERAYALRLLGGVTAEEVGRIVRALDSRRANK